MESRDVDPPAERLRALPSVERLARLLDGVPHSVAVRAAREAVASARGAIESGDSDSAAVRLERVEADARARAQSALAPGLRRVLNATGVIVHTNLGRAPLAPAAADAAAELSAGYSNLEYDLEHGRRGSRQDPVGALVCELTGAEAALVVNNCAAAVLLAAAALAAGRDLVVSRGQLVEIGGSFRIPDVVAQSGARLVEVGTTNRTRASDYRDALGPDTGGILRVHPSNFRAVGFVCEVEIEELCAIGAEAGVPVVDDAGSGALAAGIPELAGEPLVRRSVAAGCAAVCFSPDKLLGGPQAGVLTGSRQAIERCRAHPLARALRIGKLPLAALEATLRLYRDAAESQGPASEVPALRMLTAGEGELRARAELMRDALVRAGVEARVTRAAAKAGGGALPLLELHGPVCAVDPGRLGLDELARRLRGGEPPVVGRSREGLYVLDPRTLDDDEAALAAGRVASILTAPG